jgi:hypothetical protein
MGLLCHFLWSPPSDCYLVNVVKKSLPIEKKANREKEATFKKCFILQSIVN